MKESSTQFRSYICKASLCRERMCLPPVRASGSQNSPDCPSLAGTWGRPHRAAERECVFMPHGVLLFHRLIMGMGCQCNLREQGGK